MARFRVAIVALLLICGPGLSGPGAAGPIAVAGPRPATGPALQSRAEVPHAVRLVSPNGLALDAEGSLYISDIGTHQVVKRAGDGRLTVVAGTGVGGFNGDGGPAAKAQLFAPHDLAFDADGNLLVADSFNHRIRRIDRRGVITTVAGTGASAYTGDGGGAAAASLNGPQDVAVDRDGGLLIADTYNNVVRRIDRAGVITTFAGSEPGLAGDGGLATKAQINMPTAVAVAPDGTVVISDAGNSRIRRVALDGSIQTIAGSGLGSGLGGAGFAGDGGPPEKSKAFSAMGLFYDTSGTFYISDSGNNRVRAVSSGVIGTIAGSGQAGFGGDGGKAVAAFLNTPQKIVVGAAGRLFIADRGNGRVRMVNTVGVISTIAGDGRPTE